MQTSIRVFLIHGTFARGAAWTSDGSVFRDQLEEELSKLGYHDVFFEIFDWSGKNSHQARRKASVCFERTLRQSIRRHPNTRHFVVAHSHGGNIAVRALRRSRYFSGHPVGVITLATPFLRFEKVRSSLILWPLFSRGFATTMMAYALLVIIVPLIALILAPVIIVGFFVAVLGIGPKKLPRQNRLVVLLIGTTISLVLGLSFWLGVEMLQHWGPTPGHWVAGMVGSIVGDGFSSRLITVVNVAMLTLGAAFVAFIGVLGGQEEVSWANRREIVRTRRRVFRRFAYLQPESAIRDPVLCLSSRIDEALGALSGVWMMHKATSYSVRTIIATLVVGLVGAIAYAIYAWTEYFTTTGKSTWLSAAIWDTGTEWVLMLGFLVIAWVAWAVVAALGKLAGYSSIGLGMKNPDFNLLWNVSAKRDPELGSNAQQKRYGYKEIRAGSTGLLLHSRLYSQPSAIRKIALWIRAQIMAP